MTKPFLLLVLAAPAVLGLDPRLAPGFQAIREADLRADLTFLASDALEGRWSLHRGSEVAIQFIAAEFAKAGLKPLAGNSFLQTVPLVEYRMDPASRITMERQGQRHDLRILQGLLTAACRMRPTCALRWCLRGTGLPRRSSATTITRRWT